MTRKCISIAMALMLALTAVTAAWGQSFYIGGYKAVRDDLNGIWLCSIPREYFGEDWAIDVQLDSTWGKTRMNGCYIADGEALTFESIAGGKHYPVIATINGETVTGSITFTWLPVMELNGDFGYEYTEGTVSLSDPNGTYREDMRAKLKWRGGLTNGPNSHKRNYSIKFLDKETGEKQNRRLLGMRKDNHWKLDGGQIDPLRLRNRVCSDLWLDMARQPWYAEQDPTVVNGSHGKTAEVILNGSYQGIFGVIEPVDRKQLALVQHDTVANEFHGQQWACKLLEPTWKLPPYDNNSETWNGFEVSYPDFEDVVPTDWSTLHDAFEFARACDAVDDYETFAEHVGEYFDIPVMEDYFILIVATQALDNESKNIHYSCRDKTADPRLTLTAWDLDISLGAQSQPYLTPDIVSPERPVDWFNNVPLGNIFFNSPKHRQEIIDRYRQLRETWLNTDSLVARVQRAVEELELCGAAAREEARWSHDSDLGGKALDISAEAAYVTEWIQRRMAYLDEYIFVDKVIVPGDVDGNGIVDVSDASTLIDILLNGASAGPNADVDGNGVVDVSDISTLIDMLMGK